MYEHRKIQCDLCGKVVDSKHGLSMHKSRIHKIRGKQHVYQERYRLKKLQRQPGEDQSEGREGDAEGDTAAPPPAAAAAAAAAAPAAIETSAPSQGRGRGQRRGRGRGRGGRAGSHAVAAAALARAVFGPEGAATNSSYTSSSNQQ